MNFDQRVFSRLIGPPGVLGVALLASCTPQAVDTRSGGGSPGEGYSEGESGTDTSTDNVTDDAGEYGDGQGDPACEGEARAAAEVLSSQCASCHGNGASNGGFGEALDLDAIVARGLVVPGDPDNSGLYRATANGSMPFNRPDLSAGELRSLEDWILCIGGDAGGNDDGAGVIDDDDDDVIDDDDDVIDDDDDLDVIDDDDDVIEDDEDEDDAAEEAIDDDEDADEDADEAIEEGAEDDDD
jgi:hypothetical protein